MDKVSRPCRIRGCPNDAVDGFGLCQEHLEQARASYDKERPNTTQRGYSSSWHKVRAVVLKLEPYCRECKIRRATEVHHLDGNVNNLSMGNLVPLCKQCHAKITLRERREREQRRRQDSQGQTRG